MSDGHFTSKRLRINPNKHIYNFTERFSSTFNKLQQFTRYFEPAQNET